jgi:hypothetical protein
MRKLVIGNRAVGAGKMDVKQTAAQALIKKVEIEFGAP